MGVVYPGKKLPKSCQSCNLHQKYGRCYAFSTHGRVINRYCKIDSKCPLTFIPDKELYDIEDIFAAIRNMKRNESGDVSIDEIDYVLHSINPAYKPKGEAK